MSLAVSDWARAAPRLCSDVLNSCRKPLGAIDQWNVPTTNHQLNMRRVLKLFDGDGYSDSLKRVAGAPRPYCLRLLPSNHFVFEIVWADGLDACFGFV